MQENRQEKSFIKQKILLYLSGKSMSQYEFYKISGITRGVLSQNNGITEDNLMRFLAYAKDINLEWLFYGEGTMLKTNHISEGVYATPADGLYVAEPNTDFNVRNNLSKVQENSPLFSDLLETIKEQAETIGRLKARIEDLESQIADSPCDMSNAG